MISNLTWQSCCILLDFRKNQECVNMFVFFVFIICCDIKSYPTIFLYSFGWSSLQPLHQPYKTSLQTLCFTFLALLYNLKRPLRRCLVQSGMWLTGDGIANTRWTCLFWPHIAKISLLLNLPAGFLGGQFRLFCFYLGSPCFWMSLHSHSGAGLRGKWECYWPRW